MEKGRLYRRSGIHTELQHAMNALERRFMQPASHGAAGQHRLSVLQGDQRVHLIGDAASGTCLFQAALLELCGVGDGDTPDEDAGRPPYGRVDGVADGTYVPLGIHGENPLRMAAAGSDETLKLAIPLRLTHLVPE